MTELEDQLDGCDLIEMDLILAPTRDEDLPYVALFADVELDDRRALRRRRREWLELFG
jgi:hypothetical protein